MLLTLLTSSPTVAQNTPCQNSSHCCCCCCCLWHCCCCAMTTAAAAVHPAVGPAAGTLWSLRATHPGASVGHGGPDHAMQEHILLLHLLPLLATTGAISLLLLLLHSTSRCWPRRCCRTAATAGYFPLPLCLPWLPRTLCARAGRVAAVAAADAVAAALLSVLLLHLMCPTVGPPFMQHCQPLTLAPMSPMVAQNTPCRCNHTGH
jgi:hypothetical protein